MALYAVSEYTLISNPYPPSPSPHQDTFNLTILAGVLIDSIPVSTTTFHLPTPPSVGPSGAYYRLALLSFDKTGFIRFPIPTYTSLCFLANATGVLSSYETPPAEPNFLSVSLGRPLYSDSGISCSIYDCVRQCARTDPPFCNASTGVNDFGKTFYDIRYIECMESCPGVQNLLSADTDASTTTGTGVLPTVTPEVNVANKTCNAEEGMTPCGDACCADGSACYMWGSCAPADEVGASPTTTIASPFLTGSMGLIGTSTGSSTVVATSSMEGQAR